MGVRKTLASLVLAGGITMAANSARGGEIAYVITDDANPRVEYLDAIDRLGHECTVIRDSEVPSTNFNNYDMMLVAGENLVNYESIPVTKKNSLLSDMARSEGLQHWKLGIGGQVWLGVPWFYSFNILENSPLVEGVGSVGDSFLAYDSTAPSAVVGDLFQTLCAPGFRDIVKPSHYGSSLGNMVLGQLDQGQSLLDGSSAEATTVYYGLYDSQNWTSESGQIFENSIEYLIPEPSTLGLLAMGAATAAIRRKNEK